MKYYDAHTHLNTAGLYEHRKDYYQLFLDSGGKTIITVGMNPDANSKAIELAQETQKNRYPIYATVGIHPYEIGHGSIQSYEDIDQQVVALTEQLEQYSDFIVAVGEGGIDAHYPEYEKRQDLQKYAFTKQCDLARHYKLPIVIHSRSNFTDTYAIIKNYADCQIYFHCRGYGPDELTILVNTFPYLRVGFCGNVTYPKAKNLQASLQKARTYQQTQQCKILFETDAPYLAPQQYRGQKNHPAFIIALYDYAVSYLQVDLSDLQDLIEENILGLFRITQR